MMYIKDEINSLLTQLSKMRENYIRELEIMPAGYLMSTTSRGKPYYYHVFNNGAKNERKGISNDKILISKLARKRYLQEIIPIIDNDISVVKRASQEYKVFDAKSIINIMPNCYRTLPTNFFLGKEALYNDEQIRKWMNEEYNKSSFKIEECVHTTSFGLKVRSKSELLIAEKLYEYDIPFRYEEQIEVDGKIFIPDFSGIYTKKISDRWYWEHCGMTSDKYYMHRHHEKMIAYERAGIVPWKNLIVTYDDEDGHIDIRHIISEIENKLL